MKHGSTTVCCYCVFYVRFACRVFEVVLSVLWVVDVFVGFLVCFFECLVVEAIVSIAALLYEFPERKPGWRFTASLTYYPCGGVWPDLLCALFHEN